MTVSMEYLLSISVREIYCLVQPSQQYFSHMSCLTTKLTKWHVHPAKTQISLGIRPVWSESLLSAWRKLGSLATHRAHSEDSDQTVRIPRLISVFAGHKGHFVGFVMRRLIRMSGLQSCGLSTGQEMRICHRLRSARQPTYTLVPKISPLSWNSHRFTCILKYGKTFTVLLHLNWLQ